MALDFSICELRWERYQRVSENLHARECLQFQAARGLAANTLDAYGRDLDACLSFLGSECVPLGSVRLSEAHCAPTFEASRNSLHREY
jgi:hypothetical protein